MLSDNQHKTYSGLETTASQVEYSGKECCGFVHKMEGKLGTF